MFVYAVESCHLSELKTEQQETIQSLIFLAQK